MADSNVLNAQKYLNAMFGGHPSWIKVVEDGYTGSAVMTGIIRAFQIENGISSVTGTVGSLTISKMKNLGIIEKMDPSDVGRINVCLIQCALFCKGYNAGGITGIYYNAGVAAVSEMQADAGLKVTGKIDWKVWAGLLSMNWFKMVSGGSSNTQLIQRQINTDWSDIIGVGPCDGVVSRQTALSLIGALQAAEGVTTELITDLNSLNFGDATTKAFKAFPGTIKSGQNSEAYIPFNKLAQYGLYFNGYHPGRFDGIFVDITKGQVEKFQEFYGLTGIGLVKQGEVDVSTMKSLLTSKGDIDRSAKACDCATVLNKQQAIDLKNAGYTHVGRYLTGTVGSAYVPKGLTLEEIKHIKDAGLAIFPIYQDGGYYLQYFQNPSQGTIDAQTAVLAAERIGIPANTTIYFAVDFDCYEYQINSLIIPYFRKINLFFRSDRNSKNYKVGIYAPRYVCTKIGLLGLAQTSFVADMSTGFSCNLGFPLPFNWAFDQFNERMFPSSPSFAIDKDAYSGRDTGVIAFNAVEQKTQEEIEEENRNARSEIARTQYIYDVLDPLGYLDKILDIGISYEKEILLATYATPNAVITTTVEFSCEGKNTADVKYNIPININNELELTTGCQDQINAVTAEIDLGALGNGMNFRDALTNIALSVQSGNISFRIEIMSHKQIKAIIGVSTDNLQPEDPDVEVGIAVEIGFTITFNDDNGDQFNEEEFAKATGVVLAGVVIVAAICLVASGGTALPVLAFLTQGGYVLMAN